MIAILVQAILLLLVLGILWYVVKLILEYLGMARTVLDLFGLVLMLLWLLWLLDRLGFISFPVAVPK